eukprot:689295-Amphidinium_carterae.1
MNSVPHPTAVHSSRPQLAITNVLLLCLQGHCSSASHAASGYKEQLTKTHGDSLMFCFKPFHSAPRRNKCANLHNTSFVEVFAGGILLLVGHMSSMHDNTTVEVRTLMSK